MVLAVFALVAAIATVIVVIAAPHLVDASAVVALKLIVSTRLQSRVTIRNLGLVLVGAINTIRIAVADPVLLDTHGTSPVLVGRAFKFRVRIAGSSF
jgi:hypothetical protein